MVATVEQILPHQDYIASESNEFISPETISSAAVTSTRHGIPDGRSRLLRNVKHEMVFQVSGSQRQQNRVHKTRKPGISSGPKPRAWFCKILDPREDSNTPQLEGSQGAPTGTQHKAHIRQHLDDCLSRWRSNDGELKMHLDRHEIALVELCCAAKLDKAQDLRQQTQKNAAESVESKEDVKVHYLHKASRKPGWHLHQTRSLKAAGTLSQRAAP